MRIQKWIVALALTVGFMGGYSAVAETAKKAATQPASQSASQPASQPSTQKAKDSGNTKCLMMPEDDITDGVTAEYKGVTYHFCCKSCVKAFNKNPEKYVKAFEADPAKFGVKK